MLSINTNLSNMIAQSSMKNSTNKLNEAVERMSTGYRINHAKDNAANYSISTNMSTKLSAYDVAADNVAMGMDMLTTASDNMTEMENLGKRLHALSTQARNGTYGKQSLDAIQTEANSIIDEIDRLYSTAKYNGISLFNQKEYDIHDNMPKADPVTGFIENPYDYTEEDIAEMISISNVDSFESGKTYSISSAKELKRFADIVNDGNTGEGSTFVLTADIDLIEYSSGEGWEPIGNDTNQFKGTFNGNGHIISNLTINRPTADYQGLFGYAQGPSSTGNIKNIFIEDASIVGKTYVGAICGYARMYITNSHVEAVVKGYNSVGGVVGFSGSHIGKCYVDAEITGNNRIGGLAGECYSVESCFVEGSVSGNEIVGGLCGSGTYLYKVKNSFTQCYVEGKSFVGGLLGRTTSPSLSAYTIINNFSNSNVNGENISTTGSFIGGFHVVGDDGTLVPFDFFNNSVVSQNLNIIGAYTNTSIQSVDFDGSMILTGIKEFQLKDININLQVGTKSDENSQIGFNTNFEYSLGRIKRDGIQSDKALTVINDFINTLSEKQTQLGATQNRLDSALDEITTQYENLASARSTIRDADMAELSSQYIQQQILQEASATLMAVANQSPAIALQLI